MRSQGGEGPVAKYAINQEGIDSLKGLSSIIRSSATGVVQTNNLLKNEIMPLMDDLGIYGFEIWEIILHVNDLSGTFIDDANGLADRIMNKVNEMEMLMSLTANDSSASVSSSNATSSSGQIKSVQSVEQIASWIHDVNPHYHDSNYAPWNNPYHVNCGSCAFAVENRFLGNSSAVADINNIGTDAGMEQATGKTCKYMSVDDIGKILKNNGPGSHLIVGINRKRTPLGKPQAGHWFNAYYDGQNIYTIDGQSGEILDWPYDYGDISQWCAMV